MYVKENFKRFQILKNHNTIYIPCFHKKTLHLSEDELVNTQDVHDSLSELVVLHIRTIITLVHTFQRYTTLHEQLIKPANLIFCTLFCYLKSWAFF